MPAMNLPVHWKTARLGDVTDIFKGGTPKRSVEKYFRGDIPWAIPTDITALDSALYIDDTDTHISEEALGKSAARLLPAGTVLLTSRATIGETAITTIPMATNQGFANFMCKEMLLNVYLAYYLRYVKKRLIDLAHGSTFKEITKGTLLNVEIPLPPLPEQRAIAHVLQTIQEAKAARQRELALEHERKAALMDHLFSYGTKGEPRKQTEVGEIPESCEVVDLGDLIDVKHGYAFKSEYFTESGDIVLTPGNFLITGSLYWGAKTKFTSQEYPAEFLFEPGDLVVVMTDLTPSTKLLGASAFIPIGKRVLHNQRIGKILLKNSLTSKDFLYWVFNSKAFRKHMALTATGSTVRHTSPSRIKGYKFGLPLNEEQQEITEILQACDTKIKALEQEAAQLDELFHAMLDELMTGQRSAVPLIDSELPK